MFRDIILNTNNDKVRGIKMIQAAMQDQENEKYLLQIVDAHVMKRITKKTQESVYCCLYQSDMLSLDALTTYTNELKVTTDYIGAANINATLTAMGNGYYQATVALFSQSAQELRHATEHLTLLDVATARNYMLTA